MFLQYIWEIHLFDAKNKIIYLFSLIRNELDSIFKYTTSRNLKYWKKLQSCYETLDSFKIDQYAKYNKILNKIYIKRSSKLLNTYNATVVFESFPSGYRLWSLLFQTNFTPEGNTVFYRWIPHIYHDRFIQSHTINYIHLNSYHSTNCNVCLNDNVFHICYAINEIDRSTVLTPWLSLYTFTQHGNFCVNI